MRRTPPRKVNDGPTVMPSPPGVLGVLGDREGWDAAPGGNGWTHKGYGITVRQVSTYVYESRNEERHAWRDVGDRGAVHYRPGHRRRSGGWVSDDKCQVAGCDRPVSDAFVCQHCTEQLTADLRRIVSGHQADSFVHEVAEDFYAVGAPSRRAVQVGRHKGEPLKADQVTPGQFARQLSSPFDHNGGLLHDLDATFDRQARIGAGGGRSSSDTALVWHERAGELRMKMCATLVRYARIVAAARSVTLPDDAEPLTTAMWLARHVPWLRHQLAGAAAVYEIHRVVDETMQVIDRAADRWYAGPCTAEPADEPDGYCGEDLYAKPDSTQVTCRRCGQTYLLEERRDWLKRAARDYLAHAELIGRAAASFGVDITPSAIRGYAHRGRIAEKGRDKADRPLYRVGDVLDVAEAVAVERARRAAKKAG